MMASNACLGLDCDRHSGEVFEYRGGRTSLDGLYYETGAWDEPFLHFPAGRVYELRHDLLAQPSDLQAFVTFAECPLSSSMPSAGRAPRCAPVDEDSGGSGFTESAGNQAIFELREDDVLSVRNDTCAEFYLRVVARAVERDGFASADASAERDSGL